MVKNIHSDIPNQLFQIKLVFLDTKTIGTIPNQHLLDQFGEVIYYPTTQPDQTWERIRQADIVMTNKVVLNREMIASTEKLKLICVAATGTNNIDKAAALKREIPVKNVSDYSTNSVAQGTFALLLHLLNKLSYFDQYVKQGFYSASDIFTHFGRSFRELTGKRFGIIGLGISQAGCQDCDSLWYGCSLLFCFRSKHRAALRLELEEFLSSTDIVSIHAPLNEFTFNLINYDRLRLMKRSAILLNAGRGEIVNEADLARALNEDLIAGAGVNVFSKEPIVPENPLVQENNPEKIVLAPHITWASIESRTLLMEKISKNIKEFIKENRTIPP
ncbi:MAG: NAD(P)-dependent oxidoreductase [Chitinophagaceae bacterium]